MGRQQQIALIAIIAAAVLIYATLGAGLLGHSGSQPTISPDNPRLPNWTGWLDTVTAPFQPKVTFSRRRYEFAGPGSITLPASDDEVRRAALRVSPPGAARLTYDCSCRDQDQPAVWPRDGTPADAETVSFAVYAAGGLILVQPLAGISVRITPE